MSRTNWAGNHVWEARSVVAPSDVAGVRRITGKMKVLGAGHSFNAVADTAGTQVSLEGLKSMALGDGSVTVGAGVRYGELAPWLEAQGLAVHNLASLPHITVAGGCATGTHGSGIGNGSLATAVRGLEFVDGLGRVQVLQAGDEGFAGAVVGLGALGVVTRVTLATVPRFTVAQAVYEGVSFDRLAGDGLRAVMGAGYSVSLFTDWQRGAATQAWVKRVGAGEMARQFFGATLQREALHPIAGHSAEFCTAQMGVPGAWFDRLPHFRMEFMPSSGQELQAEYFVPFADGYAAIRAVEALRAVIEPLLLVSEIRAVAVDALWLSMAYERQSLALHFTWKPDWAAVRPVLGRIEAALRPFGARPHWGKMFCLSGTEVRELYPRMNQFLELRERFDPEGRFGNSFTREYLST